MRSVVVLPLLATLSLALAGCPEPLVGGAEERWVPVEGAPATRSVQATDEQREEVRRIALEARVKKMRAAFVTEEEARCTSDDECELTAEHCCNCNAGGRMAAVNKQQLPELLKRRGVVCPEYMCAQVISDDSSCAATRAVCREGRCVPDVSEGAGHEPKGIGVEPIPDTPSPAGE